MGPFQNSLDCSCRVKRPSSETPKATQRPSGPLALDHVTPSGLLRGQARCPPASPGPALWAWPGTSPDASCCSADTMSTLSARPCLPAQPQEWDNYVALARAHSRATGPCEEGMRKEAEPPGDASSRQPATHSTGRGASGCRKGRHLVGESGSLEQG